MSVVGVSRCGEAVAERKVSHAQRSRPRVVTPANRQLVTLLQHTRRVRALRCQPHTHAEALLALTASSGWSRILWANPGRARRAMSMAATLLRSHPERVGVPPSLAAETASVLEAELNEPWEHWLPLAPEPVKLASHVIVRWRRQKHTNWRAA